MKLHPYSRIKYIEEFCSTKWTYSQKDERTQIIITAICNENNSFAKALARSLELLLQFAEGIIVKYNATHPRAAQMSLEPNG
jgi:hypothetical protein